MSLNPDFMLLPSKKGATQNKKSGKTSSPTDKTDKAASPSHQENWEVNFLAWIKGFLPKINAELGEQNCNRCALALDDIFSHGIPESGVQNVSSKKFPLFTYPKFKDGSIIRSEVTNKTFLQRCKKSAFSFERYDLSLDNFNDPIIELDFDDKPKEKLHLYSSKSKDLFASLRTLPRRKGNQSWSNANTSYGFIVLTWKKNLKEGHILNYVVSPNSVVYIIDPQKNEIFTDSDYKAGFRDEIFYYNSHPPEGFFLKKEESKAEIKVKSENMEIDNSDLIANSNSGSTNSNTAANSSNSESTNSTTVSNSNSNSATVANSTNINTAANTNSASSASIESKVIKETIASTNSNLMDTEKNSENNSDQMSNLQLPDLADPVDNLYKYLMKKSVEEPFKKSPKQIQQINHELAPDYIFKLNFMNLHTRAFLGDKGLISEGIRPPVIWLSGYGPRGINMIEAMVLGKHLQLLIVTMNSIYKHLSQGEWKQFIRAVGRQRLFEIAIQAGNTSIFNFLINECSEEFRKCQVDVVHYMLTSKSEAMLEYISNNKSNKVNKKTILEEIVYDLDHNNQTSLMHAVRLGSVPLFDLFLSKIEEKFKESFLSHLDYAGNNVFGMAHSTKKHEFCDKIRSIDPTLNPILGSARNFRSNNEKNDNSENSNDATMQTNTSALPAESIDFLADIDPLSTDTSALPAKPSALLEALSEFTPLFSSDKQSDLNTLSQRLSRPTELNIDHFLEDLPNLNSTLSPKNFTPLMNGHIENGEMNNALLPFREPSGNQSQSSNDEISSDDISDEEITVVNTVDPLENLDNPSKKRKSGGDSNGGMTFDLTLDSPTKKKRRGSSDKIIDIS